MHSINTARNISSVLNILKNERDYILHKHASAFQLTAVGVRRTPQYVDESECWWQFLDHRSKGSQKCNALLHSNQCTLCFHCTALTGIILHTLRA